MIFSVKPVGSNAVVTVNQQAFPLVEVSGPAKERGIQYGQQAGERIAKGRELYRDVFETRGVSWEQAMQLAGDFAPRMRAYDAQMFAEMEGIAEGAEQPLETVIILNARTELTFWHDRDVPNSERAEIPMLEDCSSLLVMPEVSKTGTLLHAQNWDWNPDCADTSIVLKIYRDDAPDIMTFVEAGQLARHGMNSAGIALTANGLQCELDGGHIGVPNPLIRRRILEANSLAEALDTLLNADITYSHALTVSHSDGEAFCIETTPQTRYWLEADEGLLVHANHFKSSAALARHNDIGLQRCPESLYRDSRMLKALRGESPDIDVGTIKAVLGDKWGSPDAILRSPKLREGGTVSATVASEIMEPVKGRMWLASKPFNSIHYSEYTF